MNNSKVLKGIFESSAEGILLVNMAGEIVLINPSSEQIFGYKKAEVLGRKIESLIPKSFRSAHVTHRQDFFKNPHQRKMGKELNLIALRKDGTEFPIDVCLGYSEIDDEIYAIAFIVDITERKISENALRESRKQLKNYAFELEKSNRELENFAYITSHDLQEPLRKIRTFGERVMVSEVHNISDRGKDYLLRMVNSAERMQTLINDLLTYSRLSTKGDDFKRLDLNDILLDVLSDLEISIENKNGKIEFGKLPAINGDPTQIRQLFQNLVSNALKFIADNVTPKIKIYEDKSFHEANPLQVLISVEDNGIGIEKEHLDKIFQIFQRLHGKNYSGSGIGLSICKKIAHRHGGDITAKSIVGKGSVFKVILALNT